MDHGRARGTTSDSRRYPRAGGPSHPQCNNPTVADGSSPHGSFSRRGRGSGRGRNSNWISRDSFSGHSNSRPTMHWQKKTLEDENVPKTSGNDSKQPESFVDSDLRSAHLGSQDTSPDITRVHIGEALEEGAMDVSASQVDQSNTFPQQISLQSATKDRHSMEKSSDSKDLGHSGQLANISFNICLPKTGTAITLKASLLVKNREKRNELKRATGGEHGMILRPGMVLLKGYLSMNDQVKIVKQCQVLGQESGGFYQPSYHDGARLHLKMMCLGKHWEPNSGEYSEYRLIDGAKPPSIPPEFHQLVVNAIKDSHSLIERNSKGSNVESIIPSMLPNICIVNFYSATGRLGLHQDKDESQESLRRGLPVVSFSIGDSGEFLYSDQRDIEKANKVVLESGDVLIFGGSSRHIFHGVSSVLPETAPKSLLEETNLRPGRLNLTFRQY